ncbi:MAG: hypothetical protein AAGE18_02435 [Pseudomonadota bacterium]
MELIADGLLIVAAAVAGIYCLVLSRRVRGLRDLDSGVGGAIARLSHQVGELQTTLESAKRSSSDSAETLRAATERAEAMADRLERLMAERETTIGDAVPRRQADISPLRAVEDEDDGHEPEPATATEKDVRQALRDLLGALGKEGSAA